MARKILLADDSVTAQNMGRKILADAGYEVITVNNGSAALKKIAEARPDLIVLDVYMPGYSGLEVCQRLKEVTDTARIPVLLTVGKLEPFKPEEAKRVRADGFIVKPFEASELLSALSKLEDKIVPVAEPKPGRLARVSAAIDEGRRDKTVAAEEDSGWKNRIAFPSKKKDKAAEPEAEESAIYNQVNKDLRTVVDSKASAVQQQEEARVDVGALAPEGLPKDVTAEEIAALAAAAAQVQGKILENQMPDRAAEKAAETQAAPVAEERAEVRHESFVDRVEAVSAQAAARAESPREESRFDQPKELPSEAVAESVSNGTLAAVDQEPARPQEADSGSAVAAVAQGDDAPVTMAVAAGSESRPQWTAVAVALAPEETGISLEEEMRKTYASFAAAEVPAAGTTGVVASSAENEGVADIAAAVETSLEPVSEIPAALAEVPAEVQAEVKSEDAAPLSGVAHMATDAISAVVKSFETVASTFLSRHEAEPEAPAASAEAASVQATETPAEPAPVVEEAKAEIAQPAYEEAKAAEQEQKFENPASVAAVTAPVAEQVPVEHSAIEPVAEAIASPDAAAASFTHQNSSEHVVPASNNGGRHDAENIAETTAAAWANWRRTREGEPSSAAQSSPSQTSPEQSREAAAMAVAAGAEKSPEEVATKLIAEKLGYDHASDPAIASIVDSVLADLRPKIVEEISRKLGKK